MGAFKIGFSGSRAYDSRETRSNISDPGVVKVDVTTKTDQESYWILTLFNLFATAIPDLVLVTR